MKQHQLSLISAIKGNKIRRHKRQGRPFIKKWLLAPLCLLALLSHAAVNIPNPAFDSGDEYGTPRNAPQSHQSAGTQEKQKKTNERDEKIKQLFDDGKKFIYAKDWEKAIALFSEITSAHKHCQLMDAALYWMAFSQNKLSGTLSDIPQKIELNKNALSKLELLEEKFPDSRWVNDGQRLMMEIAESLADQGLDEFREYIENASEDQKDEAMELKLMALQSLANMDEEKGYIQLEKIILSDKKAELRRHALFVLTQLKTPRVGLLLLKVAQADPSAEVRMEAISCISQNPGPDTLKNLLGIYAKNAGNEAMKQHIVSAIASLGTEKAVEELIRIYKSEKSLDVRKEILFVLGGVKTKKSQEFILSILSEIP